MEDERCAPPKQLHASWSEWNSYRETYLRSIGAEVTLRESHSVNYRNRQLELRKTPVGPEMFLPSSLKIWKRKYVCAEGWQGQHDRRSRKTCCTFGFTAESVRVEGRWMVRVHHASLFHAHSSSGRKNRHHVASPSIRVKSFVAQCLLDQIADELTELDQRRFAREISFLEGYLSRLRRDNARDEPVVSAPSNQKDEDVDMKSASIKEEEEEEEEDIDQMSIQDLASVDITVMGSQIEKLGLGDLLDVLPTIEVKRDDAVGAAVTLGRDPGFVADVVSYLLPEQLVERAVAALLPSSSAKKEVISLVSDSDDSERDDSKEEHALSTQYVVVEAAGSYTTQQLRAMQTVYYTKRDCEMGKRFLEWLRSAGAGRTYSHIHRSAKAHRPNATVKWHARTGLRYSHVYRMAPGEWFATSIFEALGTVWARYNAQLVLFPTVHSNTPMLVPPDAVQAAIDSPARWILLPVNAGDAHWTGIIIDKADMRFTYYDSLCHLNYQRMLDSIVSAFKAADPAGFAGYSVAPPQTLPFQTDGYSCGLCTSFFFWQAIDPTIGRSPRVLRPKRKRPAIAPKPVMALFRIIVLSYLVENK